VSLLFLFVDGVGLGVDDPAVNPFAATATENLDALAGGSWSAPHLRSAAGQLLASLDATLGIEGRPQSATGQSALISGRNAAALMGGHYGPWPGPTLKRFLDDDQLFQWATSCFGEDAAAWASAFPPGFFAALESGRIRLNALAYAARSCGVPLPELDAYRRGDAVAADLDGAYFASTGVEPPGGHRAGPAGAERAGARLAELASRRPFTFLDVWITDRAGHRADLGEAAELVAKLDAFVGGTLAARRPGTTVLLCSDHGNLEDLRHGRHTRARVPLLVEGPQAERFAGAASLLDVAPVVRSLWASGGSGVPGEDEPTG